MNKLDDLELIELVGGLRNAILYIRCIAQSLGVPTPEEIQLIDAVNRAVT